MEDIVIYTDDSNNIKVDISYKEDTFWLSLAQISLLFERDKSVISRHINKIFKDNELDKKATVAKNATVQKEGNRTIERQIINNNKTIISNEALASLTLFIATSKTDEANIVKRFVISILNRNLSGC